MTSWTQLCALLVLVVLVASVSSQCSSPCESYHFHDFPAVIDSTTHYFTLEMTSNGSWSHGQAFLSSADDECSRSSSTAANCSLLITESTGTTLSGNFTCPMLENVRGDSVMFILELELQDLGACEVHKNTAVFANESRVSELSAQLLGGNICNVTLKGCFPPCCGNEGMIQKVKFGADFAYRPMTIEKCRVISLTMSIGDSSSIYDGNPALSFHTGSPTDEIEIGFDGDYDNLQYCFSSCSKQFDLGHKLRELNQTKGCFSINATLSPPQDSMVQLVYETYFSYCSKQYEEDNVLYIQCVAFDPEDKISKDKITVDIYHRGDCGGHELGIMELGEPVMVPCMDERCQRIKAFNVELCLAMCIEQIDDGDDKTVEICEMVAEYALLDPILTSDNVSIVLEVLVALSNSSTSKPLVALSIILDDLLNKLENEENIHLVSVETGKVLLSVIDRVLRTPDDNSSSTKIAVAPVLLENLEVIMRIISVALNSRIISSDFEYAGTNAILYMSVSRVTDRDYLFPSSESSFPVKLKIPRNLVCESLTESECAAVVSSVITRNLPLYLDEFRTQDDTRVNTLLLSTVIDSSINYRHQISQNPITMSFTPLSSNFSNETCVFWDPMNRVWSSDGLATTIPTGHNGDVVCTTNHLTSFAVLVNPKSYESTKEIYALGIVTYIGCAISLACLLASLLVFFTFKKSLNKGVLLYIHINFSIALSLALALFVAGIESATSHSLICTIVAAALHYLFLCVFCWMLAEGIMLYLLVVRVFGNGTDKWYYLLLLGWGFPLLVVAVSLGLRHEEYGTENYCWLSPSNGTFWAFLGPIIFIIATNCIILVLTVGSMIRSRRKFIGSKDSKNWRLALTAVKSTIILLPLLGLAWIIGPFTLINSTSILSWIFAILNSLQGLFFFILHVLRNDKVYDTMKKILRCIPATVMEKPYNLRGLSSNITLASAESVATASTSAEGLSQLDCERVGSPPFNIRIFQRKTSEGSAISLSHPTVSVFNE